MNHRNYNYFNPAIKIVVALVVVILSFGWGSYLGKQNEAQKNKDSAETAVRESLAEIFGKVSVNNLQGKIVSVSPDKKSVIVEISSVFGLPLPRNYQTKTLLLSSAAEIIETEQKTTEEFQKELAQAKKKLVGFGFTPPSPVNTRTITADNLKPGEQISFSVADSGKIILDDTYEVSRINVSSGKGI